MVWVTLGTVSPSYDWQFFDTAAVNVSLFRIIQTFNGENPGKLLLASQFADDATGEYLTIFPSLNAQVFDSILSQEMNDYCLGTRYIICKMPKSSRVYANTNWQITLQAWN